MPAIKGRREGDSIRVLLATGSSKLEKYIKDNVKGVQFDNVALKSQIITKNDEYQYDVIVLSPVLPGVDDIKDIIFDTQRSSNCRIVYFGSTNKKAELIDVFMLGVKDLITTDPIDPRAVIKAIQQPATYGDAINIIKAVPVQPNNNKWVNDRIKNIPETPSEITKEAREVIEGLLKLLRQDKGKSLEESLYNIETGINNLITKKL